MDLFRFTSDNLKCYEQNQWITRNLVEAANLAEKKI